MSLRKLFIVISIVFFTCNIKQEIISTSDQAIITSIHSLEHYVDSIYNKTIMDALYIGKYYDEPPMTDGKYRTLSPSLQRELENSFNAIIIENKTEIKGPYNFLTLEPTEGDDTNSEIRIGWSNAEKHFEMYQINLTYDSAEWKLTNIQLTGYR